MLRRETTAGRHRVARVHGEIEYGLIQANRIQPRRRWCPGDHIQRDPDTEGAAQQGGERLDRRVQVHGLRHGRSLALKEGDQLTQERRAASGCDAYDIDFLQQRRVGGALPTGLGTGGDDAEQVVEVVDDRREPSVRRPRLGWRMLARTVPRSGDFGTQEESDGPLRAQPRNETYRG